MKVKQESTENSRLETCLVIEADEFQKALHDAYLEKTDVVIVPGFAPGLAPRDEIEKIYGKNALYDEALDICIPAAYKQYLSDKKLHPVGKPELAEITWLEDGGVSFLVKAELYPEVTLGQYKGIETGIPREKGEEHTADVLTKACRNMRVRISDTMIASRLDTLVAKEKMAAAGDPVYRLLTDCVYILKEAYHAADVHRPVQQVRAEAMDQMLQSVSADNQGIEIDFYLAKVKEIVRRYHDLPEGFDEKLQEILSRRDKTKAKMTNDEILDEVFEAYLGTLELNEKQWREDRKEQARDAVMFDLLFTAVADREGLRVNEAEVYQAVEKIAQQCSVDLEEAYQAVDQDALREQLIRDKAREFILSHAVIQ